MFMCLLQWNIKFSRTFKFVTAAVNFMIVAIDMHFISQYVITKAYLTHAHSVYAVLTGVWCLEMKDERSFYITWDLVFLNYQHTVCGLTSR
jgi:hypothetical protein